MKLAEAALTDAKVHMDGWNTLLLNYGIKEKKKKESAAKPLSRVCPSWPIRVS